MGHWARTLGHSAFNSVTQRLYDRQVKLACPLGLSFLACKQGQEWCLKHQSEVHLGACILWSPEQYCPVVVTECFTSVLFNMATPAPARGP